jgi:hypothetical protein
MGEVPVPALSASVTSGTYTRTALRALREMRNALIRMPQADPNIPDVGGFTPLINSAYRGDLLCVTIHITRAHI